LILDSSAVLAILRDEPEAERFARAIEEARSVRMSTATYVELGAVVDGGGDPIVSRRLDQLLDVAGTIFEPVTIEQMRIARAAYRDFGRGSGHSARLNYGDCFAYALAEALREPLLFKGDDFGSTDVEVG
jgi:ribonuclease VapC